MSFLYLFPVFRSLSLLIYCNLCLRIFCFTWEKQEKCNHAIHIYTINQRKSVQRLGTSISVANSYIDNRFVNLHSTSAHFLIKINDKILSRFDSHILRRVLTLEFLNFIQSEWFVTLKIKGIILPFNFTWINKSFWWWMWKKKEIIQFTWTYINIQGDYN